MEIKEVAEHLSQMTLYEETRTTEYLDENFSRHQTVIDLSNKYLFPQSLKVLLSLLHTHFVRSHSVKKLVLQNCMLEAPSLTQILQLLLGVRGTLSLKCLDIGNNRLQITPELAELLRQVLDKCGKLKLKTLCLQGNLLGEQGSIAKLLVGDCVIYELNLYDVRLSPKGLMAVSEALSINKSIHRLDLAYNVDAFTSSKAVQALAMGLSLNTQIERLNLSGNTSLASRKRLTTLFIGMSRNRTLETLVLSNIGLQDRSVKLIVSSLLMEVPICEIDLQNNGFSGRGICYLLKRLPPSLKSIDLSYNSLTDCESLRKLAAALIHSRDLRKLSISHAIELDEITEEAVEHLCRSLRTNDSLTEFICEGVKIAEDPDLFCRLLGEAIATRQLSLTFKISAVNCFKSTSTDDSSLKRISMTSLPMKLVSTLPSNSSPQPKVYADSTNQTERRAGLVKELSFENTPRGFDESNISLP
jgi:Ran GTPase-activating protein (RanGAP) involved in mRNA processing and transport